MFNKLMHRGSKGFTLVELIVVIAIICVLAAVIIPNAFKQIEKSKVANAVSDYDAIKSAALSYYSDVGEWPLDGAAKTGFVTVPASNPDGWMGPYVERWPSKNPWKGTIIYNCTTSTYFGTNSTAERYVTLTNVPASAVKRLLAQLDSDIVKQDGTTATTVRLLISRDD